MMRALAIICARNEQIHLRRCLSQLIADGLDVILIDHDSTDDSVRIASEFLNRGLLSIETLRWEGCFSLDKQLALKHEIAAGVSHDWIVHVDADEWLCSDIQGRTLLTGIAEADRLGFNCINFHEVVFVPRRGSSFETPNYASLMTTYYFFEPEYPRLMRAWKRKSDLSSKDTGGHRLVGADVRTFPRDLWLRHYIVLSLEHAREKYLNRVFDRDEIAEGQHGNRVIITRENLVLPDGPALRDLPSPRSVDFDVSQPMTTHFWEWPASP